MRGAALVAHQFRYDQKTFWRNGGAVFFTVLLPLVFLFIFATIFGNDTLEELGNLKTTTYYVPAILTLAIVSATMTRPSTESTIALPTRPAMKTQLGNGVPRPRLRIPVSRPTVSEIARLWAVAETTERVMIAGTY